MFCTFTLSPETGGRRSAQTLNTNGLRDPPLAAGTRGINLPLVFVLCACCFSPCCFAPRGRRQPTTACAMDESKALMHFRFPMRRAAILSFLPLSLSFALGRSSDQHLVAMVLVRRGAKGAFGPHSRVTGRMPSPLDSDPLHSHNPKDNTLLPLPPVAAESTHISRGEKEWEKSHRFSKKQQLYSR